MQCKAIIIAGALVALGFHGAKGDSPDPFGIPQSVENKTYIITFNNGVSEGHDFLAAVADYQKRNIRLVIAGPCLRLCVLAALDMNTSGGKICIGRNAEFGLSESSTVGFEKLKEGFPVCKRY